MLDMALLFIQEVGIPKGTKCAPLLLICFLYCYERDFRLSISSEHQDEIITAFNNISRYLDDLFYIDNHFSSLVNKIYKNELRLNKANTSEKQANLLDLNLSTENGFVTTKLYDKSEDLDFNIVNYSFVDCDVPRATSWGFIYFTGCSLS